MIEKQFPLKGSLSSDNMLGKKKPDIFPFLLFSFSQKQDVKNVKCLLLMTWTRSREKLQWERPLMLIYILQRLWYHCVCPLLCTLPTNSLKNSAADRNAWERMIYQSLLQGIPGGWNSCFWNKAGQKPFQATPSQCSSSLSVWAHELQGLEHILKEENFTLQ